MQFSLEYKNLLHRAECSMFAQIELFAKNESLLDVLESFFLSPWKVFLLPWKVPLSCSLSLLHCLVTVKRLPA